MKHLLRLLVLTSLLAAPSAASAAIIAAPLTGSVSGAALTVDGTGNWLNNPISLSWNIVLNAGVYTYTYTFTHAVGDTSHFILAISDGKDCDDISQISGGTCSAGTFSGSDGNSNPGLPNPFYGIKFDGTSGTTTVISFQTTLDPIYGSFYSKNGNAGGDGENAAWNTGLNTSSRPELGDNLALWIATPDGFVPPPPDNPGGGVPEPATLALFGVGLLGAMRAARRRQSV